MVAAAAAALATASPGAPPRLVLHDGTLLPSAIEWESTIVYDQPVAGRVALDLAVPLPPDAVVLGEVIVVRDGSGAVRRIETSPPDGAEDARWLVVRVRQPLASESVARGDRLRLAAPLLEARAPQGVALRGESGARFTPDARLGIEHRVGRLATHGLDYATLNELESAERAMGRVPAPWRCWLEVEAPLLDAGGLIGTLETGRPRRGVVLATAFGFVGVVALLGAGVRGLARVSSKERDEAILERELERMRRDAR